MRSGGANMQPYAQERVSTMRLVAYDPATGENTAVTIENDVIISASYIQETAQQAKSQLSVKFMYDPTAVSPTIEGVKLYAASFDGQSTPPSPMLIDRFNDVSILYDRFSRTATLTAQRCETTLAEFGSTKGDANAFAANLTVAATYAGNDYSTLENVIEAAFDENTAAGSYNLIKLYEDGIDGVADEFNDVYKAVGTRFVRKNLCKSYFNAGNFVENAIEDVNELLREGKEFPGAGEVIVKPIITMWDEGLQETVRACYQLDSYMDEYGDLYVGYFKIHEWYDDGTASEKERDIPRYKTIYEYPGKHAEITSVELTDAEYASARISKDTLYGQTVEINYRGDIRLLADDVIKIAFGGWTVNGTTKEAFFDGGTDKQSMAIKRAALNYTGGTLTGTLTAESYNN